MNDKLVRYRIDLAHPPALTDAQKAQLEALQTRPDAETDVSDIPPLSDDFWQTAVRNPMYGRHA